MSGLVAAEKHPVVALSVFAGVVWGLILLLGWSPWVAFSVAVVIGVVLMVAFVIDVSAPYRTFDCRGERHGACVECWCECHTSEAGLTV